MTLRELAEKHGQLAKLAHDGDTYSSKHSCAGAVHAWPSFEHNYGALHLESEDYLAALESSQTFTIHAPANCRGEDLTMRLAEQAARLSAEAE